jgi:hypothetical protein
MSRENPTDRTDSTQSEGGGEESQRQEGREGAGQRDQVESPVRRAWEKAGEQPDTTPYRESQAVPEPEPMDETSEG